MSVTVRLSLWVALAIGLGCGSTQKATCKTNTDCAGGFACVNKTCLPRGSGVNLAVEIVPPGDSLSALTELPGLALAGQPISLTADDKTSVLGTVAFPAMMAPMIYASEEAHVVVTIPSLIPSHDDRQITTEMVMGQFMFAVPEMRLNVGANLRFTPGIAGQTQPPISLPAKLTPQLDLSFPGLDMMTKIYGQLLDADGAPIGGYVARASFQSVQISNALTTAPDGTFGLLIPPGAIPVGASDLVSLTLTPATADTGAPPPNLPQLITNPTSLATLAATGTFDCPNVYKMPPTLPTQLLTFTVMGNGDPQSGVNAYFHTEIPSISSSSLCSSSSASAGMAIYEASASSDMHGLVSVSLIPGTDAAPRVYQVAIQGPTDPKYDFASVCIPDLAVNVGADGTSPPLPTVPLTQRFHLSGSVSDSTAAPAVGATVTATQTASAGASTTCGHMTGSPSFSAIADTDGNYHLLVDPGTYRIDVEPPAMAAWPRLTEPSGVTVSHATVHPISLPVGQAVEGSVLAADMVTPLGLAKITIFQVFCDSPPCDASSPPVVLGQTQSDVNGNFATVLPIP